MAPNWSLVLVSAALLINAKFGVVSEYLEVCDHVLHLLIAFFQALGAGFEAREAWMRRLLAIDGGGASTSPLNALGQGTERQICTAPVGDAAQ